MGSVEIDVFKAQLVRRLDQRWGFEIEGGQGTSFPLTITNVINRAPAGLIGLKYGDEITEIFGSDVQTLSASDAMQIFEAAGDTLALTIERRASERMNQARNVPEKSASFYQPANMIGGYKKHISCPKTNPFQTAYARTFNEQDFSNIKQQERRNDHNQQQQPQQSRPTQSQQHATFSQPQQVQLRLQTPQPLNSTTPHAQQCINLQHDSPQSDPQQMPQQLQQQDQQPYVQENALSSSLRWQPTGSSAARINLSPQPFGVDDVIPQSRSFRVLHSYVNQNDAGGGVAALPLARSAALRRQKQDRVKVLMPAQYNSPMGIYSAENVLDTFKSQAADAMLNVQPTSPSYEDFGTDL